MYLKRCIAGWLGAAVLAVPVFALAGEPAPAQRAGEDAGRAARPAQADRLAAVATEDAGATEVAAAAEGTAAGTSTARQGIGSAASPGELDGMRGTGVVSADATLSGTLSGNSAAQVATGSNVIQSGSFANASGLPVVIQNSGANVLIQNATVINLELR